VSSLVVRFPDGRETQLQNVPVDQIVAVPAP
jgi:hypothetical protein